MKECKRIFIEKVSLAESLASEVAINAKLIAQLRLLNKELSDFSIFLPLLGNFNAGKSYLLNAIMGISILPTELLPETAIATELYYGAELSGSGVYLDGREEKIATDNFADPRLEKYQYLKLFVPSEALKEFTDIVFVDMPGLDSGLERHNKALMQYVKKGVAYILVVNIEDGTLKKSVMDFLDELASYNLDLIVVLNKSDKIPFEEGKRVFESIKGKVCQAYPKAIVCVASAANSEIDHLKDAVKTLNSQKMLIDCFKARILDVFNRISSELMIRYSGLDAGYEQIEKTIAEMKKRGIQLDKEVKETIAEYHDSEMDTCEKVLEEVHQALTSRIRVLAERALISEDAFKSLMVEIIRPVLINSIQKLTSEKFLSLTEEVSLNLKEFSNPVSNLLDAAGVFVNRSGSKILPMLADLSNRFCESAEKLGKKNKIGALYKTIAGFLGIATTVVSPVLEIVIFFLPEIFSFLKGLIISHDYKVEQVILALRNEIIPQIKDKLRPDILKSIKTLNDQLLEGLKQQVEEQKEEITHSLQVTLDAKKTQEEKLENDKAKLQLVLDEINNCIETVVSWS